MLEKRRLEPASGRLRLWTCYGGMMCVAVAVNLPPLYLTTFSETFGGPGGLSAEQLGRIPAVLFASLTAGIIVSGPLADRWGAKVFAILGPALTGAGLTVMALAGSYEGLLAGTLFAGAGVGILDMILSPVVAVLEPRRRPSAMNWLHSFYCIGAVLTVTAGSAALRLHVPWRVVFVTATALPGAVAAGFALMTLPPLSTQAGGRERGRRLLRQWVFLAALAAIFFAGATEAGMGQWLPTFAERSLGRTKSTAGVTLAAFLVAMAAGRIATASLADRVGPVRLMIAGCVGSAVLYLVGSFCPVVPVALVACIGIGLTVSCLWPTMLAVSADRFPAGGATMFAMLAAFGNVGCFLMPWVVGVVGERSGLNWGLATVTACPALMAVLLARQTVKKGV